MDPQPSAHARLLRWLREPVNSLTHLAGALLSLVALVLMLVLVWGDPWKMLAFALYGVSMVVLYTASTLLHSLRVRPEVERALRIFDHAAIFGLIAGTYTPVTLVTLKAYSPTLGVALFSVAWGFALLGIVFKIVWIDAPRWLSTGLYLLMGWLAIVAARPLLQALPPGGLLWLALGGLFYTVGALVYASKRPDPYPGVFGYHELWHLFVLAASGCHFIMMLRYVLPA